jgi:hypothetical protein
MSFNTQDFLTGFLTELKSGVTERFAEAKEYREEQKELAKLNKKEYYDRKNKVKAAQILTADLIKMGADARAVMYYAKDGYSSLEKVYEKLLEVEKDAKDSAGRVQFTPQLVKEIMNIPNRFKAPDEDMQTFWEKTYNLHKEHESVEPGEDNDGYLSNFFLGAMGVGAKDRVDASLDAKKYIGDMSIKRLNEFATEPEYTNIFGEGTYDPAAIDRDQIPYILGETELQRRRSSYDDQLAANLKEASRDDFYVDLGLKGVNPSDEIPNPQNPTEMIEIGTALSEANTDLNGKRGFYYELLQVWARDKARRYAEDSYSGSGGQYPVAVLQQLGAEMQDDDAPFLTTGGRVDQGVIDFINERKALLASNDTVALRQLEMAFRRVYGALPTARQERKFLTP